MEQFLNQNIAFKEEKPIIEFRGVSKTYPGGTHALDDVNIKINNGEFVFIVGSSGAGKSTFMKLIMREEKTNIGKITVNGFDLTTMKRKQVPMLRRTMGIVFQDFRLIPTMNVFDNVAFAMHVVGASGKDVRREVTKALSKVGLGHKARSMPNQLSGGEQQRVAIARAIAHAPTLIFADEPTAELDTAMGIQVVDIFKRLIREQGVTIVMTTHDPNMLELADCVYTLLDGVIIDGND